jgi:hypothetical protein
MSSPSDFVARSRRVLAVFFQRRSRREDRGTGHCAHRDLEAVTAVTSDAIL